jgi:hypothetical protein
MPSKIGQKKNVLIDPETLLIAYSITCTDAL